MIEHLELTQERIVIDYGDTETGKSWCEGYCVSGRIGRSTGHKPIPILIHNARSRGGVGILTHRIIKISESAGKNKKAFYKLKLP